MKQVSKRKREIIFIILGIVLLFLTLGYTIYAIQFLAKSINQVIQPEGETVPITQFDLEGLDPLFESGKLERLP